MTDDVCNWCMTSRQKTVHRIQLLVKKNDTGYPLDGCADKDSYPHDSRADKDSYPHDRHNQYIMLNL